jgi:hypothetical protein
MFEKVALKDEKIIDRRKQLWKRVRSTERVKKILIGGEIFLAFSRKSE